MARAADLVAGCGWGARQQQDDWLAAAGLELTAGRSRLAAAALAAWQVDLAPSHPETFHLPAEAAWWRGGRAGGRPRPAGGRQATPEWRPPASPPATPHSTSCLCPRPTAMAALAALDTLATLATLVALATLEAGRCTTSTYTPGQGRGPTLQELHFSLHVAGMAND